MSALGMKAIAVRFCRRMPDHGTRGTDGFSLIRGLDIGAGEQEREISRGMLMTAKRGTSAVGFFDDSKRPDLFLAKSIS